MLKDGRENHKSRLDAESAKHKSLAAGVGIKWETCDEGRFGKNVYV